jgi:HPt (histidine-containing phosphotransfer) domain-containing protein
MTEAETDDKTASLLAAIWRRNRPLVEERLALLERAAVGAAAGALTEELREEARGDAHKLAGSLGMYGYDEGTLIARQIELMLLGDGTPDAARLGSLVAELRRAVFPEA